MKTTRLLPILFLLISVSTVYGQHHDSKSKLTKSPPPLSFESVLSKWLSDPELKEYKMESSVMTIQPGAIDTVSHRHDCELFGYVLEGEVQIGLENKPFTIYKAGEMFYERRNILHNLAGNNLKDRKSKVLLITIIKKGREGYKPEYIPATSKN